MSSQNLTNYKRYHPLFHFFLLPLCLIGLVLAVIALVKSPAEGRMVHILLALAFFLLFNIAGLARIYAMKVQDRVIRQEENFRHYLLAGKPLDRHLRTGQIIALRFASDAELVDLAARSVAENLSPRQIKESIKHWRGDHRRV
ncbi:MAG: hypothetical protein FJX92_06485 [Bacteroidetes bacterium]|nr:hypothetical protein [Bacteroidota bacterium]